MPLRNRILDLLAERMGDRADHRVGQAAAGHLDHLVADVVDEIFIVALAAGHGVGALAADDQIEVVGADDDVGEVVAAAEQRRARQGQVLDVVAEGEVEAADHQVGAAAGEFNHAVEAVAHVDVVAAAASHEVEAALAVDLVGARIALEHVVSAGAREVDGGGAKQRGVLELGEEAELQLAGEQPADGVGAFAGRLAHGVELVVDVINVVVLAAGHAVGAGGAVEGVVAAAAAERVGGGVAEDEVGESRCRCRCWPPCR